MHPKSGFEEEAPGAFQGTWGARAWPSGGQLSEGGFRGPQSTASLLRKDPSGFPETAGQLMVQDLVAGVLAGRWA